MARLAVVSTHAHALCLLHCTALRPPPWHGHTMVQNRLHTLGSIFQLASPSLIAQTMGNRRTWITVLLAGELEKAARGHVQRRA